MSRTADHVFAAHVLSQLGEVHEKLGQPDLAGQSREWSAALFEEFDAHFS